MTTGSLPAAWLVQRSLGRSGAWEVMSGHGPDGERLARESARQLRPSLARRNYRVRVVYVGEGESIPTT